MSKNPFTILHPFPIIHANVCLFKIAHGTQKYIYELDKSKIGPHFRFIVLTMIESLLPGHNFYAIFKKRKLREALRKAINHG